MEMKVTAKEITARNVSDSATSGLLEALPDAIVIVNQEGQVANVNSQTEELFGYAREEILGQPIEMLIPERFRGRHVASRSDYVQKPMVRPMGTGMDLRARRKDGSEFPVEISLSPMTTNDGVLVISSIRDITIRRRMEGLLDAQREILELIAMNHPLTDILHKICQVIEDQSQGMLCSILILDGTQLHHGAAPSLPDDYTRAIDGIHIGSAVGSCGTAAYRKEPVIVSDIATDPLWAQYCELALRHGLRACWSTPILSSAGSVLGTFAMYYHETRSPTAHDENLIDIATHLASVGIERRQEEHALREISGHLIHAQEEERSRIARELHDSVSQKLALLAVELDILAQRQSRPELQLTEQLQKLVEQTRDISTEIYNLSYQLHPSQLAHVGLDTAIKRLCMEITEQSETVIEYSSHLDGKVLPSDAALCLYRVTQESLRNVLQHSNARDAHVELTENSTTVNLRISDSGVGFDTAGANIKGRLGLLSMRERARLVGGKISIHSKPAAGTCIDVEIPLSSSVE